jgi:hypothetical protein
MVVIPVGYETINQAYKALCRIHHLQFQRHEINNEGPSTMGGVRLLIQNRKSKLYALAMQNGSRRTADCAFRDSYSIPMFYEMMQSLWKRPRQYPREYDLIYRDAFCISCRHNCLMRDEDLRHIHFADSFCTIVTRDTAHIGTQQIVALTFKVNQGKINAFNQNWYACAIRHDDVRRCCFSAFAFYMFQLWQVCGDNQVAIMATIASFFSFLLF